MKRRMRKTLVRFLYKVRRHISIDSLFNVMIHAGTLRTRMKCKNCSRRNREQIQLDIALNFSRAAYLSTLSRNRFISTFYILNHSDFVLTSDSLSREKDGITKLIHLNIFTSHTQNNVGIVLALLFLLIYCRRMFNSSNDKQNRYYFVHMLILMFQEYNRSVKKVHLQE